MYLPMRLVLSHAPLPGPRSKDRAAVNACTNSPRLILMRQPAQVKDLSAFRLLAQAASKIRLDLIVTGTGASSKKTERALTGTGRDLYNKRCKLFRLESARAFRYSILLTARQ
jgi:hypothetical protein